jgi:hypothetical protein
MWVGTLKDWETSVINYGFSLHPLNVTCGGNADQSSYP